MFFSQTSQIVSFVLPSQFPMVLGTFLEPKPPAKVKKNEKKQSGPTFLESDNVYAKQIRMLLRMPLAHLKKKQKELDENSDAGTLMSGCGKVCLICFCFKLV